MILGNCNDIINELTRCGGHYTFWNLEEWKEFKSEKGRLFKWMKILDGLL